MKRICLYLILYFAIVANVSAKTTYIPTYYTQININGEGVTVADSTLRRELTMMASDGRYSITVMHDSVTTERVKAIKRMKAAAGWATASAIMSGVSATLNPMRTSWDAVNYMSSVNLMASSTMLHVAAKSGATSLQRVNVTILIENHSDREMVINDMNRGLTWYVPAHNYIDLSVGNPEVNKLRIAYADCQDQKKDYVTVQACNILEKQTIEYEDENIWVYPVYIEQASEGSNLYGVPSEYEKVFSHYELLDKVTFETKKMTKEEFKEFKKSKK